MNSIYRWISKHKTMGFLLSALVLCGLYTFVFISCRMALWLIILLNLVLVLVAYLFSQGCYAQIVNKAIKVLNEQCNPYPLLEETAAFLSYRNKEYHRQMLTINYCAGLIEIGELQKAYQLMSAINIDQCNEMLPLGKVVYYENLFHVCHALGHEEAAKIWLTKGNQLFAGIKSSNTKKRIEPHLALNNAEYLLHLKEYDQALQTLQAISIPHLRAGVSVAMASARIYLAKGDQKNAEEALHFVIQNGNQLYCVQEAKKLLEELD